MITLPSKKLVFSFGALLIVLALFLFVARIGQNPKQESLSVGTVGTQENIEPLTEKDTDKDGLKDWQEALWQSDPKNPDTDGDGTNDGDEIIEGRNPTVAGPDDALSFLQIPQEQGVPEQTYTLTQTDLLSRELYSRLSAIGQSGDADSESVNEIVKSITGSFIGAQEKYTSFDINRGTDNSAEALKNYGNALGGIVDVPYQGENELDIISSALENESGSELSKLAPIIAIYEKIEQDMLAVETPPSLAQLHLELLNAFSIAASSLSDAQQIFDDPIRGISGIGTYQESALSIQKNLRGVKIIFTQRGIFFQKNEPGFVLFE